MKRNFHSSGILWRSRFCRLTYNECNIASWPNAGFKFSLACGSVKFVYNVHHHRFFRLIFYSFLVFNVHNSEMFMGDLLNINYIYDALIFSVYVGKYGELAGDSPETVWGWVDLFKQFLQQPVFFLVFLLLSLSSTLLNVCKRCYSTQRSILGCTSLSLMSITLHADVPVYPVSELRYSCKHSVALLSRASWGSPAYSAL